MRWSARSAIAWALLLTAAAARPTVAVESFLDGNPKAPEAIHRPRHVEPTPVATPPPPSPPR